MNTRQTPPRNAYHHGALRQELMEAGLSHLESADRHEISLRDLARRVGVTANAVYRHFANKEALLEALSAEGFRRLQEVRLPAETPGSEPFDPPLAAARGHLAFAHARPALYRLMFRCLGSAAQESELADAAHLSFDKLLAQVAHAYGLSPQDPQVLAAALYSWALTHGLSQLVINGQFDHLTPDPKELADAALEMITQRRRLGRRLSARRQKGVSAMISAGVSGQARPWQKLLSGEDELFFVAHPNMAHGIAQRNLVAITQAVKSLEGCGH
ncbi:MAG: TetR/AcrR family transcriptional regulator [Gammaproteobacteria bacterium]